jgi:hypothetical protein
MFEFSDAKPRVQVQTSGYLRLLGFPRGHALGGRAAELTEWARDWYARHGRPWVVARTAKEVEIAQGKIRLDGAEFGAEQLRAKMLAAEAHGAVLVAVSAGAECEEQAGQCWQAENPDEYFFLEVYGSAVVEQLIAQAAGRICAWADEQQLAVLPHYSPGYPGWSVDEQPHLLGLFHRADGRPFPGELGVMPSGMLRPKKSQLAVFGLTRQVGKVRRLTSLIPCQSCSLDHCQYRRAPYLEGQTQIEDVHLLQCSTLGQPKGLRRMATLTRNARYSLNERALRKWSAERLELQRLADGSIQAQFRYDGTTCTNLGHPLAYEYHVRLGPPEGGYRIEDARCAPVRGDMGHTQQCEYLANSAAFGEHVASEKPLLGRPLNDVLGWERPAAPSGCYCDAARRLHKWGLVLEVLHFALVQEERLDSRPSV